MALLKILKGAAQSGNFPLQVDKVVLGRNPDCQIIINGNAVSRAHAQILNRQGRFYIEDLLSRNKTYVNNQEIAPQTPVLLKDNDRIKICDFLCTFHDPPAATKLPLPADLRKEEPEPQEEPAGSTTVEASVSNLGSNVLLEAQPAEKLKALLDISASLSKTLELDPLLPKIVENLFQLFKQADRGFIILRDEGARLIPKVIRTRRPNDETTARFSRRIVNQCLENVQALLSDDASSDSRFALSQSIADFRIRSVMCAPLWSQDGTAFGVIQLDTQDRTKKFTQEDLKLLTGVASQASIALENAKLHEDLVARERLKRDLELAREVQRSFLPLRHPDIPGYDFFAHYEAAQEVGGDYFDFVPLSGGRWAIMLGDVAGKGVPAALLMAKISSDARFCMLIEPDPAKAITKLNHLMHQAGLTERFVTVVAAILDPKEHEVTLVNAGHPSPMLYRRETGKVSEAVPGDVAGLPIGVLDGHAYSACRVHLQPGDCIVMFSDGVTEAMDVQNNQLQHRAIHAAFEGGTESPHVLGQRMVKAVKQHAAGRSQHDDITLVCFGRLDATGPSGSSPTVAATTAPPAG
jgi:serine phosphatase RsbU (regulator of sigma subunit)/pSer/pThr/pTyr-binding forkhead associated (FHA) protein